MKINIGGRYLITSDSMNVVLNQRYEKKKDGIETCEHGYKQIGFYSTLEQACNALMDREIKLSDAENLSELVKVIYDTKALIKDYIKEREDT